ncbi:MAG TPA: 2-C-methyl-D-erythritol 2,4-cyclodiphosphate synthase [Terriglobales bacterium]|nr:2-C-methyl-D-erythritol 2,4-cyclodiphosphate synthase [Terriglobales bacterium]
MRIGHGYDIHRLVAGRSLRLGGIDIASPVGLLGHSDGDAVLHAICDAILGALAAGDIGGHFPDTDPAHAGVASAGLLQRVVEMMQARRFGVVNLDVTIYAEQPKLAPHREPMRQRLAELVHAPLAAVSIKAKTNEGLDAVGRGEAIAATAVVLLAELPAEP